MKKRLDAECAIPRRMPAIDIDRLSAAAPHVSIERTIEVHYRHQIFFTDHVFDRGNALLRNVLAERADSCRAKVLVILDESLAHARLSLVREIEDYFESHAAVLELVCAPSVVEGGERVKNSYFHVSEIQSRIDRYHIDRHSYVVAVGGGALLDMAGLAAATAHRGVRHVRIPTTTLSQNDSGVGVKNGINSFGKKNFIGAFAPPFAVINDFQMLATLAPRDLRAGYIEAVKVALIRDAEFFCQIERNAPRLAAFEAGPMRQLIFRCAELHVNHIATSGDPFESGSARPLDFGHWAAHKLEQLSEFRIRHGEAVAMGVALDVVYSRKHGFLDPASAQRILQLIESLGFDLFCPEMLRVDERQSLLLLDGLEEFREHLGGSLTLPLIRAIGEGFEIHEIDSAHMIASIYELRDRHQDRTASEQRAAG